MKLPNSLKNVFWDTLLSSIDSKKNKGFVIARVAEKGRFKDVSWLKKTYGKNSIRRIVKNSKNVSLKTKNFWSII